MSVPGVGIPAVSIREVGPRDGLQIEDPVSLAEKLRLVDALAATGVSRIEATSFVSPRAVPALADAELLAAELHQWPGIEFSALVAGIGWSETGRRRRNENRRICLCLAIEWPQRGQHSVDDGASDRTYRRGRPDRPRRRRTGGGHRGHSLGLSVRRSNRPRIVSCGLRSRQGVRC